MNGWQENSTYRLKNVASSKDKHNNMFYEKKGNNVHSMVNKNIIPVKENWLNWKKIKCAVHGLGKSSSHCDSVSDCWGSVLFAALSKHLQGIPREHFFAAWLNCAQNSVWMHECRRGVQELSPCRFNFPFVWRLGDCFENQSQWLGLKKVVHEYTGTHTQLLQCLTVMPSQGRYAINLNRSVQL